MLVMSKPHVMAAALRTAPCVCQGAPRTPRHTLVATTASLFGPGRLQPCPSHSRRRDRIDLGLLRSLYKGGGADDTLGPWGPQGPKATAETSSSAVGDHHAYRPAYVHPQIALG